MVILYAAQHRLPVPRLARWMLALGILASLAVNVAQGCSHGLVGAVVAAWRAVSLVGVVRAFSRGSSVLQQQAARTTYQQRTTTARSRTSQDWSVVRGWPGARYRTREPARAGQRSRARQRGWPAGPGPRGGSGPTVRTRPERTEPCGPGSGPCGPCGPGSGPCGPDPRPPTQGEYRQPGPRHRRRRGGRLPRQRPVRWRRLTRSYCPRFLLRSRGDGPIFGRPRSHGRVRWCAVTITESEWIPGH